MGPDRAGCWESPSCLEPEGWNAPTGLRVDMAVVEPLACGVGPRKVGNQAGGEQGGCLGR